MNTNDYIKEIRDCVCDDKLFHRVYGLYLSAEAERGSISEQEYADAHAALPSLLNDYQNTCLQTAEDAALASAKWLAGFGFSRGIYAGFQQFFSKERRTDQFRALVIEQAMRMPNMQKYPSYYEQRMRMLDSYEQCIEGLGAENRGLVANIGATWQDRFLGVLRHSFYIGYRAALACIDGIHPVGSSTITDKVLRTEHELGFTLTVSERERYSK